MTGCHVIATPTSSRCNLLCRDCFSLDKTQQPVMSDATLQAIECLKKQGVGFNLVVVVNRLNCTQPQSLYRYLRGLGTPFLQFIPQLEMNDRHQPNEFSVSAQAWGEFLCGVFDVWVREDMGRVNVQLFDSTLDVWNGASSQLCSLGKTCGYDIGQHKQASLAQACQSCAVRRLCNGDCPKHRDASGKSALCEGYRAFFEYTSPYMKVMRDLTRQHRSPLELMAMLRQQAG